MKTDIRHTIYEPQVTGHEARTKAGVTLVEMLIVLAIIMILASMVIGMATHIDNQSRGRSLENTFALLEGALQEYHEYGGAFPDEVGAEPVERSEALYERLNSILSSRKILEQISNSFITDRTDNDVPEIYDPWSKVLDYRYDVNTDTFPELISAGPDRIFDTADDITSR